MKKFIGESITLGTYISSSEQVFSSKSINFTINSSLVSKIKACTEKEKISVNTFLLTAFTILLYKYTPSNEIAIENAIISNSMLNYKLHKFIINNSQSFSDVIKIIDNYNTTKDIANVDQNHNIVFDVVSPLEKAIHSDVKYNLYMQLGTSSHSIKGKLHFNNELFSSNEVEVFIERYLRVIKQVLDESNAKIKDFGILSQAEKKLLKGFNNTCYEYQNHKAINKLFEDQVKRNPNSIAVVYEDKTLTYQELNKKANQLARVLLNKKLKNNEVVGLLVERSLEMVIGIIAVLKAGGAYMPINPQYPAERINYMLTDSRANIVLTQNKFLANLEFTGDIVDIDDNENYNPDSGEIDTRLKATDAAYVIYTSGSTGRPKGVVVEHRSLHNFLNTIYHKFNKQVNEQDRCLSLTNISFDVAVCEIFLPLTYGATLVLFNNDRVLDITKLVDIILHEKISFAYIPPTILKEVFDLLVLNKQQLKLNKMLVGVEPIKDYILYDYLSLTENMQIINGYGPTEATICATMYKYDDRNPSGKNVSIGMPMLNTQIYIVDNGLKPVPVGVAGELCISGDNLARGYLHKPKLTDAKFINSPFNPNERMYKTGDLARWHGDGNIEFLGRIDYQVKIRGYRVEPGEIQNQLMEKAEIKQAVVIAKENTYGSKYLCAYLVATQQLSTNELRDYLSKKLPDYMIPSFFIQIPKIPLTLNGKIDRKALPEPQDKIITNVDYLAPRTEVEQELVCIYKKILQIDRIGINDDFFSLGGDSLKAIKMVSIIQKQLKADIAVRDIFTYSTVQKLADCLTRKQSNQFIAIQKIAKSDFYRTSSAQKRMFTLNQLAKNITNYNIPFAFIIEGLVDIGRLEKSFKTLVLRHEALRTSFKLVNNEIMQHVYDDIEFGIEYEEIIENSQSLDSLIADFIKPFDLAKELFRVKLIKLGFEKYLLLLDMHHIISDGTSVSIIMEEISKLYEGETLVEPKIQYKDYSAWEHTLLDSKALKQQEEFWLKVYGNEIPVLNLPTDYKRPTIQSFEGEKLSFTLGSELTSKLKKLCQDNGVTLYMTLLSAYYILLSKYTGQEDIIVGSAVAGRPHADLNKMVGMFVNTLALRNYPKGNKVFREFLGEVKQNSLAAFENQNYPFDRLIERLNIERDLSRNALIDTIFVLQNTEAREIKINNLSIKEYELKTKGSKLDLTLEAEERNNEIKCNLEYCTKLFKKETISRLIKHYQNILEAITTNPLIKLADINVLTEVEKKQILIDFNNTKTKYPRHKTIAQLFEEQVQKTPYNIAVVCANNKLTYLELNQKSNSLAIRLKEKGVLANSIVGLMTERTLEMVIGTLAILKAGGAYLPIDVDYPGERISYMLDDSKTKILLAESKFINKTQFKGEIINLNDEIYYTNTETPNISSSSEDLAYVIYTSGTTGRPKGVGIKQKNVVRLVKNTNYIEFNKRDRILQTGSITFDASTFEIWGALLNGLELHVSSKDIILNAIKLGKYLSTHKITTLWLTSPLFNKLCDESPTIFKGLRYLLVGGDVVSPKYVALAKKHAPQLTVINGYGPTENTTFSTCYIIEDISVGKPIPIGSPIANSTAYILDKHYNLTPIGVYGELCVGGDGLAKGYINNDELTAKKFVENPYAYGELMYRTGDLVRWLPSGNIEFLGRIDHQVKIRGFRIELAEIESSLLKIKDINEAVVIDREDNGNKYLCAYIVADSEYNTTELRNQLKKHLPDYMIPSYFITLDEMPLNQNGKINRRALPIPNGDIVTGINYKAPVNQLEQKLAEIWGVVLGLKRVGTNDDFFALGGDSLKAIKIIALIQKELAVEITVGDIFSNSTIKMLATYLKKLTVSKLSVIKAIPEKEYYEVSSAQKRMFALNQFSKSETNYNIPSVLLLKGHLDISKVKQCFKSLINRHEVFRTSFEIQDDVIVQRIHKRVNFKLEYEEQSLSSKDIIEANAKGFVKPFNLALPPLLRARLIRFNAEQHLLMFDMHHIISDGISMNIIMEEFAKLYNSEELPELSIQYKDYATWERKELNSHSIKQQESYWKQVFNDEIPILNLPTDYQRPSIQSYEGANLTFTLNKESTNSLKKIAYANGSTLYMVLLSVFNVLLAKYSGQEDIVIGSPIAGRRHADLYNMVGMFVNTLTMRNYPNGNKTFTEFLQEVKSNALLAYNNQDYPFDKLVEILDINRELSRNALFDVMFSLQNTPINKEMKFNELHMKQLHFDAGVSKFDLTLRAVEYNEEIELDLEYCTKLFKKSTIKKMVKHFINIIETLIENPHIKLNEIDILSPAEKQQILIDFNNTNTPYSQSKTICQCFEEQVKKTPNNIAVVYEGQGLSYKELNTKASQLAMFLRNKGVTSDSIVGIMVDRSLEMMIGIMAILKAGGAYMPISPEYPDDRINYMLEDSKATILLTQEHLIKRTHFNGISVDLANQQLYQGPTNIELINKPSDLAYIIYTSGSTGKPKGVMIEHGSVVNLVTALSENIYNQYDNYLNITLISPYVFDASVKQIFASLLRGHALYIVPEEYRYMGEMLVNYYIENNIDISDGTPSHFKLILSDNTERLKDIPVKHFIIGGEAMPTNTVKEFLSYYKDNGPRITNIYGPTECTVDTTAYLVDKNKLQNQKIIPIGEPLANYKVYVVNKANKLQPIGVAGELCIAGAGLARGYLNKPEITEQKFVQNPFEQGQKMYKTGDLVKWLPSGDIEFIGRIDFQVKIRGYRIEIGEIESTIKDFSSVQDTVVIDHDDGTGDKKLVAYVVAKDDNEYSHSRLKDFLKQKLPKYMMPSILIKIDSIPLNNNGKVNRFALPKPSMQQSGFSEDYVEPQNKAEKEMAEIWSKTLGIEKIGIDDDFFDIGGDSFKAIKLVRSISGSLGVMELFKNSTIRELVAYLADDTDTERTMLNELTKPINDKDRIVSLVCFPFGGGSAISYQPLANALPKNYSLYAVELPGHDYSCPNEELATIKESAEKCLAEIKQKVKGPIVLYGHCLGATMAVYMAYELEKIGRQVDGVFVGAMFPAPRISNVFFNIWDKIFPSQLSKKGNKDLLRTIGGLSSEISPKETEFILRNLKHDSDECIKWYTDLYKNKNHNKFKAPITSVIGEGDRVTEFYQERYKEWEYFSDYVDLKTVEYGGHFFFKNQATELAEIIEEKVKIWQGSDANKEAAATIAIEDRMVSRTKKKKQVVPSMNLFLTVAIVQIISEIGSIIAAFGTGIWIFQQTNALSGFAIMVLFRTVPTIIIMPFAGAIVDRFNRRLILIIGDVLAAVGSLWLLLLMYNNVLEIWHIYVFTVLASVATSFRQPAYLAAVTQITPKMYLNQANSVAQFSGAIGGIIAPICGGLFMTSIGLKGLVTIDLVSFAIAIVVLSFLKFPNTMFTRSEEPILKELMGGWNFIVKRKSMVSMVVFFLLVNFILSIFVVTMTPLVLSFANEATLGIINAFLGVGMLIGSIIMLFTGGLQKRAKGMVGFVIPLGISIFIAGLRPLPLFSAIAFFGVYFSIAVVDIHWRSLIQVKVGLELQGRVFAVNRMLVSILTPVSIITAGVLADKVFAPIMQNSALNTPLINMILGQGAGREMRITLLLVGVALFVWGILGLKHKPLSDMDNILEDASVGVVAIRDKDRLQEMLDRKLEE